MKLKWMAHLEMSVGSSSLSFLMALRGVKASLTAILRVCEALLSWQSM